MDEPFRARKVAPCFLAIIVDSMGFGLVYPLFADLLSPGASSILSPETTVAMRQFLLGLGFMMYPLGLFFGTAVLGDLSDIVGRKKILLLCMAGLAVSFLAMGFGASSQSLLLLFIGRGLSGLTSGTQPIAQAAIADLSAEQNKTRNLALMTITLSTGIVIGPLIGGFFSDPAVLFFFNDATPFYFAAILALIAFLWIFTSFHETYTKNLQKKLEFLRPIYIFVEAFKHPVVRYISILFILKEWGMSIYYPFVSVYLKTAFQDSNWQIGLFNTMLGLAMTLSVLFTSKFLSRFFTTQTVSMISFVIAGTGMLFTGLAPNQALIWAMAVFSAFAMSCYNCLIALYSNAVGKESQGWVMGIAGASIAISWVITSFVANLIAFIGLANIFIIAASFLFLGALLHLKRGLT